MATLQMLTKFESKSNRVKGLAFHPTRPLLAASLHNGSVQLWNYQMGTLVDRFEEHDGPVRGVAFHPTRPLLATGGDDYKVKVWDLRPHSRRCLFTLHGHMDYVRTVQFHHEMPWILSASDDQTIRIWNSTSRNCITMLTGHSHYIMSALFHPKEDLVVSAAQDQTVRVWDISALRKGGPSTQPPNAFDSFDSIATVKYVLEGHDRGVNYAAFHPTLPLIVSCGDDRQVKLWRMSDTKAWEVDTCRGHFNNVSMALFHPRHELIISTGEDKTIRVWDMTKRTSIQTFRREHDRFWALTSHPSLNLFAAGHDSGLIVFKLERERPAFSLYNDTVYYIRDKYVRQHDLNTGADVGVLSVRKLGNQYLPPRTLSYNPAERAVVITASGTTATDSNVYELAGLPKDIGSEVKDSSADGKRGSGSSVVFVARNRFAVLDKSAQTITVRDLSNTVTKTVKPPVTTNEIFYGGTGCLLLSSPTNVVLYDLQQQKTLSDVTSPPVKYAIWSHDGNMVALLSKHTVTIASKNLSQSCLVHETIRIKSGAWDDSGVFVYTTLNHMKFCLPNGDNGIVRTLDQPLYLIRIKGKTVHCLDRTARPRQFTVDPTEYRFKLALVRQNYDEVLHLIKSSNLVGQSIISYLQKKGYPEVALHFVQDKNTRFDLAIECGNLDVALETADSIDRPDLWSRLAQQALQQGNHKVVEKAYQRTKNFDRLSFLYLATGTLDKLAKMQKIADMRGDQMSKFHNALYAGDVRTRINVLRDVGLPSLAYITAKTNGLSDVAQQILQSSGFTEADFKDIPPVPASSLSPPKIVTPTAQLMWPTMSQGENFFEKALVNGKLSYDGIAEPHVNGHDAAAGAGANDWDGNDGLSEVDEGGDAGWGLDDEAIPAPEDHIINGAALGVEPESGDGITAVPGITEEDLWSRNSPYASDHIAAGSFETAMQLLNKQSGVVNFEPLKPLFLAGYRSAHAYVSLNPSIPPLSLRLRRDPEETAPGRVLPVTFRALQDLKSRDLPEAQRLVSANKLEDAVQILKHVLLSSLFVVPTSTSDSSQLQDIIAVAREYFLGVSIELERRRVVKEEPDNIQRNLELAAYFTHSDLQPTHLKLALRNAFLVFAKAGNYASASKFAQRILPLNPDAKIVAQAKKVISEGDRIPIDAHEIPYDSSVPFVVCGASYTPIVQGTQFVRDPHTGASFLPQYKGTLSPFTGVVEIGLQTIGVPPFRS